MAIICKPPKPLQWQGELSVFLAGTIDNGNSDDWQNVVTESLQAYEVKILNPRRDEWDDSWQQNIRNPQFKQQVEWEMEGLEKSSIIFMYFAQGSLSPISLLELGLHADSQKMLIVCPDGFWRKGNIEVVAERFKIPLFNRLNEGVTALKQKLDAVCATLGQA